MNKHQSNCFRNIGGKKYYNFCDLVFSEEENNKVFNEVKSNHTSVRKIKHKDGYYQLFVYP